MQIGELTFSEPAPGVRLYTLTSANGVEVGTYRAEWRENRWHVYTPSGRYLGDEMDTPEVAMTISLHGIAP